MKLLIEVGQDTYDVEVDLIEQPGFSTPSRYIPPLNGHGSGLLPSRLKSGSAGRTEEDDRICRSPLRGIVSRVNVEPGERVQLGDVMLVLEAMKMETIITAPRDSTVKSVAAIAGAGVQIGEVLLELE